MTIELICFDMAGTTVNDQGLVLNAFRRTIDELGVTGDDAREAEAYVIETMGQSKIDVFTELFDARADAANDAFERHFVTLAQEVGVSEIPGARATVEELKSRGIAVALTTGFSPATREVLINILGWSELFSLRVSPADAGRGRPAPDMILLCALRSRVSAVHGGRSWWSATRPLICRPDAAPGVGQCVGVLSGTDNEARLLESGADSVLDTVVDLTRLDILVA
jgi:phosphoglycolate phosphatase